jgi:CubicO group peptidase (beta-lactamase class C family)
VRFRQRADDAAVDSAGHLAHSSGLFNYTDDLAFEKTAPSTVYTPRQLVDVSLRNPVYFAPGSSWHYSNTNFILLGMVAEAAGKAKLGALAWAAGAIVATPGDVALWIEKVGSGAFYDAAMQKELLTTVHTDSPSVDYGLGIMVFDAAITAGAGAGAGAGVGIGHGGDIPGYHTQAFHFPDKRTTIVAIVDSDSETPTTLASRR